MHRMDYLHHKILFEENKLRQLQAELAKIEAEKDRLKYKDYVKNVQKMRVGQTKQLCTICLKSFETGKILLRIKVCNHIFHPDCIKT